MLCRVLSDFSGELRSRLIVASHVSWVIVVPHFIYSFFWIENMGGKHSAFVERHLCSAWDTAIMTLHYSQITSPIISVPHPLQAPRMKSGLQEHPAQAPMSWVSWQTFVLGEEIRQYLGNPLPSPRSYADLQSSQLYWQEFLYTQYNAFVLGPTISLQ